jgi:hypothetical protein
VGKGGGQGRSNEAAYSKGGEENGSYLQDHGKGLEGSGSFEEAAAIRGATKNINFFPKERQLTRSVLVISQDLICGNQQKSGVFWECVFVHSDECRLGGFRPVRSL